MSDGMFPVTLHKKDAGFILLAIVVSMSLITGGFLNEMEQQYDRGFQEGNTSGYEMGYKTGYSRGEYDGVMKIPERTPDVVYRAESNLVRVIGWVYPDLNLSYACEFDRGREWQISNRTYKYNNSVVCGAWETNLLEAWDDNRSDKLYRNGFVNGSNSSE